MTGQALENAIKDFLHPTVYTGVKPIVLVAEELPTDYSLGHITEAVWIYWDDTNESTFKYINKFAVKGEINPKSYYSKDEAKPFRSRMALLTKKNLEKTLMHRYLTSQIKEFIAKQSELADHIHKDMDALDDVLRDHDEVYLFKKLHTTWDGPLSDIDLNTPYKVIKKDTRNEEKPSYHLERPESTQTVKHPSTHGFYAYFIGSKAEIAGLKLKNESYKSSIASLEEEAKKIMNGIDWLEFDNTRLQEIKQNLPKHPYDDYFRYVAKGEERKLQAPDHLIKALQTIIQKHMPEFIGPMGIEYIPIDNLLYLFHAIIPREKALIALESCDVIYEPSALVLGFEGKREHPPKYLVPLSHVAASYQQFPAFIQACRHYLEETDTVVKD